MGRRREAALAVALLIGIGLAFILEYLNTKIRSIESALLDRQFETIELHARDSATGFYEKLGYRKQGLQFIEVSLPHWKMTKSIHLS